MIMNINKFEEHAYPFSNHYVYVILIIMIHYLNTLLDIQKFQLFMSIHAVQSKSIMFLSCKGKSCITTSDAVTIS